MSNYSVLLPGGPQSASQAAASDFTNALNSDTGGGQPQYTLPPITVDALYTGNSTGASSGSSSDLSPVVVTAQKMNFPTIPSSISDWFQPPKLFITLGIGAVAVYLLTRKRSRR